MLTLVEPEQTYPIEVAGAVFHAVVPSLATSASLGRHLASLPEDDPLRREHAVLLTYLRAWEGVGVSAAAEVPYSREHVPALPAVVARKVARRIEMLGLERHEAELGSTDELRAYVNARLDYRRMTCERCREIERVDGIPPDCDSCPVPRPSPEIALAWETYQLVSSADMAFVGGAQVVFALLGARMSASEALALLQRLIIIHQVVVDRRAADRGDDGESREK